MKSCLIILLMLSISTLGHSQLLHFSQYNHAPTVLNPANQGAFSGTLRVGGHWREQFRSFIVEPFISQEVFVDSPFMHGLKKNHWIGAGLYMIRDEAGDLGQQIVNFTPGLSYHIKNANTTIGIGVQYSFRSINLNNAGNARYEDELLGLTTSSADRNLLSSYNNDFHFLNVGGYLKVDLNKTSRLNIGLAVNQLQLSKSAALDNPSRYRIVSYAALPIDTKNNITITPQVILQLENQAQNLLIQNHIGIPFEKKNFTLNSSIGYRVNDAIIFGVGGLYKDWSFIASYDLTTSSASQFNNRQGAIELSAMKVFIIHPKTEKKLIEICPRL